MIFTIPEKFLWQSSGFNVVLTDMINKINLRYFFAIIPMEIKPADGSCLTFQELYELAPEGSDLKNDLAKEDGVEIPVEEETTEEIFVSEVVIEVKEAIIPTVELEFEVFDLIEFLVDNKHVFAKGNFEVDEIDYNWAMRNFMKVYHPVPLTVKMTTEGQIIIHYSRELLLPAKEFFPDFVK